MAGRNVVNEIIPGKLYQRGQILTWSRDVKINLLRELGITAVVNFWPKIDGDLAEGPADYLHIPAPRSSQMLEDRVMVTSKHISNLLSLKKSKALVLCEAGVTRSVFFCVLVAKENLGLTLPEAYKYVKGRLSSIRLKGFMLSYINGGKSVD